MSYSRFAIYYIPPEGPLADFGANWLGWDVVKARYVDQFDLNGLREITMTPRKYGFHGTLKPPFRLAQDYTVAALEKAVSELASGLAPAACDALALQSLGRFLALTPRGNLKVLRDLASACVRNLDRFRAVPAEAELANRRKKTLSPAQDKLLTTWGYPYVMEEFRFHMTLTGALKKGEAAQWSESLIDLLPDLPEPFVMDQIALCGERRDGNFELISRYALAC